MAAPSFVQASTGATDASGTFTFTGVATGTVGDLVILQILNDGTGVISWGTLSGTNIQNLAGTANVWTDVGIFFAGAAAQQRIFMGRRTSAVAAPTFTASANTSGDDVYGRMYEFHNASTGTTLATVIENAGVYGVIDGYYDFGNTTTDERVAQSFVTADAVTPASLKVQLKKGNSPVDDLVIQLQSDSGDAPSGSVLATIATVPAADLSNLALTEKTYSFGVSLSAATKYWLVFTRSGALDASKIYGVGASSTFPYAAGTSKRYGSGSWSLNTSDIGFVLDGVPAISTSGVTSSNTASDAAVTTLGPDRLALNFVGVNDDNAISAFTGETGGDWTLAVAPYADSGGTDGAIGLQAATMLSGVQAYSDAASYFVQGGSGTNEACAQSFTVPVTQALSGITILAAPSGSPGDNLVVEIRSGSQTGSVVSSVSIPAASLPGTLQSFNLSGTLSSGTTYFVVFTRSGARDTSNYYLVLHSSASIYGNGVASTRSSGVWSDQTTDITFGILPTTGGTIDGGTGSIVDIDSWGVVGFALLGTTVAWDQTHYRFRNDDGNETTATWKADLDTTTTYALGDKFRVRLGLAETATGDPASEAYTLQYSKNGGAFTNIGDAAADSPIRAVASVGDPADNSATTQQITTGTFSAGQYEESAAATTKDLPRGKYSTEFEWSLEVNAAASSPFAVADVIQLRVKPANETPTYTQTAEFTMVSAGPVYQPRDPETFHDFR